VAFPLSFKKKNVNERVPHSRSPELFDTNCVLDQYTPEISAIDPASFEHGLQVDADTKDLLRSLGFDSLPVSVITVTATQGSGDRPFQRGPRRQ
jgi:hypothetical protein